MILHDWAEDGPLNILEPPSGRFLFQSREDQTWTEEQRQYDEPRSVDARELKSITRRRREIRLECPPIEVTAGPMKRSSDDQSHEVDDIKVQNIKEERN